MQPLIHASATAGDPFTNKDGLNWYRDHGMGLFPDT